MNIEKLLNNEMVPTKTFREKFFYDLCHLLCEYFLILIGEYEKKRISSFFFYLFYRSDSNMELKEKRIEQNLLRYNGELRDIVMLE